MEKVQLQLQPPIRLKPLLLPSIESKSEASMQL